MEIIATHLLFLQTEESLSKPFSGSKEHAVHLFAYRSGCCQREKKTTQQSLFETKVSRNWHELLWARKAPLKPRQKTFLVRASEGNWNVDDVVLPEQGVGDSWSPSAWAAWKRHLKTSGDQKGKKKKRYTRNI